MPVGVCVWTLGLTTPPSLPKLGLPLNEDGNVKVDNTYRVEGTTNVYSIGDCAHIVAAATGRADGKTCKEATAQAARLGKIIAAHITGKRSPVHVGFIDLFCFGLGPGRGMVWTRLAGKNIVITGKLGWLIRKYTWDSASLLK